MLAEDVRLLSQKQRVLLLTARQAACARVHTGSYPPSHEGHVEESPGGRSTRCACVSKPRTFKLRNLIFMGMQPNLPNLCYWGEILILHSKPVCPLLQWETVCLYSNVIHLGNLWKIVCNKGYQCLYSKAVQKFGWFGTRFSHEIIVKLGLQWPIGLTCPKNLLPWSFWWLLAGLSASLLLTGGFGYLPHVHLYRAAHNKAASSAESRESPRMEATVFMTWW